jgi:hypothetical protein
MQDKRLVFLFISDNNLWVSFFQREKRRLCIPRLIKWTRNTERYITLPIKKVRDIKWVDHSFPSLCRECFFFPLPLKFRYFFFKSFFLFINIFEVVYCNVDCSIIIRFTQLERKKKSLKANITFGIKFSLIVNLDSIIVYY